MERVYFDDAYWVSLQDLVRFFSKHKPCLFAVALYCALMSFFYIVTQPIQYEIVASFKEQGDIKTDGALKEFKEALGLMFDVTQTSVFMKSQHILRPVVVRFGLQVVQKPSNDFLELFSRTIRAEFRQTNVDLERFQFSNVQYDGEQDLSFSFQWLDDRVFELSMQQERTRGELGQQISLQGVSLCIDRAPRQQGSFTIEPWTETVARVRARLLIQPHKQNRSLYILTLRWPDRFVGAAVVNGLMERYQQFWKEDYEQRVNADLAYLQQRKNELFQEFATGMEEYKRYLQNNVDSSGMMDLKQQIKEIAVPYRDLFLRSCALEMEEKQLNAWKEGDSPLLLEHTTAGTHLHRLHIALEDLHRERDFLETSLYEVKKNLAPRGSREELLRQVRCDLQSVTAALYRNNEKNRDFSKEAAQIVLPGKSEADFSGCFGIMHQREWEVPSQEPEDVQLYLKNLAHILAVREKILLEQTEEQPLDLEQARRLLTEQYRVLDESQSGKERMGRFINQIEILSLEALTPLLRDEVSQRVLARATELQLQVEDVNHYTTKERERAERMLHNQRALLKAHVQRLQESEDLREQLCREKVCGLQRAVVEGIHRQAAIVREQIADLICQRKEALQQELLLLKQKMEDLRGRMRQFPDKWFSEGLLDFQREIRAKLIQAVHQLVETKAIGRNLYHFASLPLDMAVPPRLAKSPHLFLYSATAALCGCSVTYLFLFAFGLIRGLPFGVEKLKGTRFAGELGRSPEQDREVLRKAFLFLQGKQPIGMAMGQGPDLSALLPSGVRSSHAPLSHSDSLALLQCEGIIVSLCEEVTDILLPYLNHPHAIFVKKVAD
jgi:hypothetical protein